MLLARDIMTEAPATVRSTTTVRAAVDILHSLEIRHLPVVDDDGALVGILSDRDVRALSVPYLFGDEHVGTVRAALEARVCSLMSADVISVNTEEEVGEVIDLMLDNKVGALPVTGEDGALVGIVSYVDVLRALRQNGGSAG